MHYAASAAELQSLAADLREAGPLLHLRHQQAGRVDDPEPAPGCGLADAREDTVRGEHTRRTLGYGVLGIHEPGTALLQHADQVLVVRDLLADVDRRLGRPQRLRAGAARRTDLRLYPVCGRALDAQNEGPVHWREAGMKKIEGETVIGCPPDVVFDFVADERNEPKFNPRMVRAELISEGPIGAGARFLAATKSMGRTLEMVIETTAYDRPARLTSTTHMSSAEIQGTMTFEPVSAGTRMRWSWDVEPKGFFRLLAPLVARMGRHQEEVIWANLKRFLESRSGRAQSRSDGAQSRSDGAPGSDQAPGAPSPHSP